MFYQTKRNNTKNIIVNTEKYSRIVLEIERFIEAKEQKPKTIKGVVEEVDLSNNILTIKLQPTKQPDLSRGLLILIKEDTLLDVGIRATVREVYNSNLKIEIKGNPLQFENKNIIIDTNKTNVILERLRNIIENIKKGKLSQDNIRILDFLIGKNKPQYNKKKISFISRGLNENQKEAVTKSIEANDFHLIIGPPGTGKTYVIEELIKQFSKRNQKLLITAWTNLAVDNVIKRLLKKESMEIVRIGPINEIDSEVKKYSIFEKMKKHKDYKEVEKYRKIIDDLFKILPKIRDEINLIQENIDMNQNEIRIFNKELDNLVNERQEYRKKISIPINNKKSIDISSIDKEISKSDKKSNIFLSLSQNLLLMNNLQSKIPEERSIKNLKRLKRNMKLSIVGKNIYSLFSNKGDKELKKLEQEYEKNKKYLNEIFEFQKKYNDLKKSNEIKFNNIYPDGNGRPDKDALKSEFKIYKMLEDRYLPFFKEQEISNTETRIFEINQEVYKIYLESLDRKVDLLSTKIRGLSVEQYIQINHKENLHKQYKNIKETINFYKKNVDKLIKAIISEIMEDADLIAATAISSCHYFLEDIYFDVMIMDEASQVASFMSLLPLSKCKKFILVGDNKQLQPIEEEDISKEMNLSLFNRLFEMYPSISTLLLIQYRMHKTIAKIANEIFYEGKLKTSERVAEKILNLKKGKHQFLNPKIPVVFIDTSKSEYYEEEVGSGCSNIKEAEYIAYIVSLFIENKIKKENIGIITPYVKQKLLIEKFLEDIKIKDVEVNTVHKFQGREKDIIIMSFARSKKYSFPQYKLKFIENETLVNVAVTRAKRKLILVGNSKTLCQSKLLDKVIDKIGKENTIVL